MKGLWPAQEVQGPFAKVLQGARKGMSVCLKDKPSLDLLANTRHAMIDAHVWFFFLMAFFFL